MLVNTMNQAEITREFFLDWEIVKERSEGRLSQTYDRERRRNRIPKDEQFSRAYEIKSQRKNNWIFLFSKASSESKYRGLQDVNVVYLMYYYNGKGIRVFKKIPSGGLSVYNGHLFGKYSERMCLNIAKTSDLVKHFFVNNGYAYIKIFPKDGRDLTVSVCHDGLMLGEKRENWIINKTFITKDLMYLEQDSIERDLIDSLKNDIMRATVLGERGSRRDDINYLADVYHGII